MKLLKKKVKSNGKVYEQGYLLVPKDLMKPGKILYTIDDNLGAKCEEYLPPKSSLSPNSLSPKIDDLPPKLNNLSPKKKDVCCGGNDDVCDIKAV